MFTLKFYSHDRFKTRVVSAESLTILRDMDGAFAHEITLHQRNGADDYRMDVGPKDPWGRVIIENGAGKTTEIIECGPAEAKAA